MPSDPFPKCGYSGCSEYRVSFSDSCWKHTPSEDYLPRLRAALKKSALESPGGKSLTLNLKRVVCDGADFSKLNLAGSLLSQAHLTACHFIDTNLSGADLIGARFGACDFVGSDLRGAHMTRAVFHQCSLSHCDLRDAYLVEAHFSETDLTGSLLAGCLLFNTDLRGAKNLRKNNFEDPDRGSRALVCEKNSLMAFESYRTLRHYFSDQGLHEDSSWASYRTLTMERKHFFETRNPRYFPSLLMDLLSGYTEKPHRVILASLFLVLSFAVGYHLLDVPRSMSVPGPASFLDSVYFSFITFTTVGYGDFIPKPGFFNQLLTCAEAFSGPFMAGLYIFTLTRRYSTR